MAGGRLVKTKAIAGGRACVKSEWRMAKKGRDEEGHRSGLGGFGR
jgi:hypothetical protein